tara:strand:+ start:785 stop:1672 length:888 start_codon:yes stop_codon:yes gene_type:complete
MSNEQITENNSSPVEQETTPPITSTETKPAEDALISSTTNTTAQTSKSWKEIISEEYRKNPNIEKFTEIDALAKSYINAVSMIGSDKIPVPTNNSTEDQWNEVYNKLGRPESADKYKLDVKSDIVPMEETSIKSFAENAHKLGLNNKQAQGILEFYKNNMEQSAQQMNIDMETNQASAEAQLRKEWGRSFDENIKRAGALAKSNMNPEVLDMQLKDGTRLGDHPEVIRGFAKIASMVTEDKFIGTGAENMASARDLGTEISSIVNDRSGPYWNRNHPDHDKSVQQVLTLRTMLNG